MARKISRYPRTLNCGLSVAMYDFLRAEAARRERSVALIVREALARAHPKLDCPERADISLFADSP